MQTTWCRFQIANEGETAVQRALWVAKSVAFPIDDWGWGVGGQFVKVENSTC